MAIWRRFGSWLQAEEQSRNFLCVLLLYKIVILRSFAALGPLEVDFERGAIVKSDDGAALETQQLHYIF